MRILLYNDICLGDFNMSSGNLNSIATASLYAICYIYRHIARSPLPLLLPTVVGPPLGTRLCSLLTGIRRP